MQQLRLGVNGTLMSGFELNQNLVSRGARFLGETYTAEIYRMWSIGDKYPAMLCDPKNGVKLALEVWQISPIALIEVLLQEPPGLGLGKIQLHDHSVIFGVLGEYYICGGQEEITRWGGWRNYWTSLKKSSHDHPANTHLH